MHLRCGNRVFSEILAFILREVTDESWLLRRDTGSLIFKRVKLVEKYIYSY